MLLLPLWWRWDLTTALLILWLVGMILGLMCLSVIPLRALAARLWYKLTGRRSYRG